jgi:hypothetical protein
MAAINARQKCRARSTEKKEMENYIHKDAIVQAYKENGISIRIPASFAAFDDVPLRIAQIVHQSSVSKKPWEELSDEDVSEKQSKAKKTLNGKAVRHMTKVMLDEIDLNGEILSWFEDMKQLIDSVP